MDKCMGAKDSLHKFYVWIDYPVSQFNCNLNLLCCDCTSCIWRHSAFWDPRTSLLSSSAILNISQMLGHEQIRGGVWINCLYRVNFCFLEVFERHPVHHWWHTSSRAGLGEGVWEVRSHRATRRRGCCFVQESLSPSLVPARQLPSPPSSVLLTGTWLGQLLGDPSGDRELEVDAACRM